MTVGLGGTTVTDTAQTDESKADGRSVESLRQAFLSVSLSAQVAAEAMRRMVTADRGE